MVSSIFSSNNNEPHPKNFWWLLLKENPRGLKSTEELLQRAHKGRLSPNSQSRSVEAIQGKWPRGGNYDFRLRSFPLFASSSLLNVQGPYVFHSITQIHAVHTLQHISNSSFTLCVALSKIITKKIWGVWCPKGRTFLCILCIFRFLSQCFSPVHIFHIIYIICIRTRGSLTTSTLWIQHST